MRSKLEKTGAFTEADNQKTETGSVFFSDIRVLKKKSKKSNGAIMKIFQPIFPKNVEINAKSGSHDHLIAWQSLRVV